MVARAVKSILRVNGESGFASDGTLEERYEYTPYGERMRKAGGELPLTPVLSHKRNVPPAQHPAEGGRGRRGGRFRAKRMVRLTRSRR